MTFDLLAGQISKIRKQIPEEVNKATQKVAKVILETAAGNTPVDTTKAISNWQVTQNRSASSILGPKVPGTKGSTRQASLQITIDEGVAAMKGRRVGTEIHIANNAPYIDGLNDGSSRTQPGAFVEKANLAGRIQIQQTQIRFG